eukprot:gene10390-gene379
MDLTAYPLARIMLLLLLPFCLFNSGHCACEYQDWRIYVSTLSSSGWETYISTLDLYDGSTLLTLSELNTFVTDVGNVNDKDNMFDSDSGTNMRFPIGSLPTVGNYIGWQCDPSCNIDKVVMSQTTGGNSIPGWQVKYLDGSTWTTKW